MSCRPPRTIAARLTVAAMILLLALGGRVGPALGSWLSSAFLLTQLAPHEEEEERHSGKGASTHTGRRAHHPLPAPATAPHGASLGRPVSDRRPFTARTPAHREADLRNGLGAPMRC